MFCTKKITDDIIFVGGSDRRLAMFEGVYSVPKGVSYNSYLLLDEKTVLFDTVDKSIAKLFFENVEHTLAGRKLDYVVVQHMEPDHSATLCDLLLRYPEAVVVCTAKTDAMIKNFFSCGVRTHIVGEGDTLSAGAHSLRFIMAPMVHWPEVMVTYDETEKIMFSADAFGTFGALNGAIFADECDFERDYLDEARRYYANIVGKYGAQVQSLLKKISKLDIAMICPLHGPVWRKNLSYFIEKYERWSSYSPEEAGVMIVFGSIYGNTENAAEILALRLADRGIKTVIFDVSVTPASEIVAAAFRYSHMVLASSTHNAGIFTTMEEVLRDLAAHNIQNRKVSFVQNGSWAPSSGKLMREIILSCKNMTEIGKLLDIKSSLKESQGAEIDALADAVAGSVRELLPEAVKAPSDPSAFFKISYGLFVLTAREGEKDNGCIVNTLQQLTSVPERITVSVNRQNFTHDMIMRTGVFNISVLDERADFEVFKKFGFSSGRDANKFAADAEIPRTANGLAYVTENTNAVLSGRVTGMHSYETHTIFVADVTGAAVLSGAPSVTYSYYFEHIKPKRAPQAAGQAVPAAEKPTARVYVCKICGYEYDEAKESIPFADLPTDWTCPVCRHPKSDFEAAAPQAAGQAVPAAEKPAARVYVCKICGYEYDEAKEGIPFADLPAGWTCPVCRHPKSDFEAAAPQAAGQAVPAAEKPAARVYVCKICGYEYDEAKEGIPFADLPAGWTCPVCRHPKSDFEAAAPQAAGQAVPAAEKPAARVYVCKICGYEYDEAKEGIPFADLPAGWTCPLCRHPKSDFELA